MKIESSKVETQVNTNNHFDISFETKSEFKQTLINKVKETSSKEEQIKIPKLQIFTIKHYENELTGIQKVSKLLIELILENFLNIKKVKTYPYGNSPTKLPQEDKKIVHTEYKFERTFEYTKKDTIDFQSSAIIKTENKDIEVKLNLFYSKEFYEKKSQRIEIDKIDFLDPLVINYEGNSNALDNLSEELTFMFDLDMDGKDDELPLLKSGNGFLVLDKNQNRIIDDGNELFGPNTNNGFGELREFDHDKNSWIDENDEIFNHLKVWTKNEDGEDKLITLGQANIGALYLDDVSSEFTYNKSIDENIAQLKSSSIYLKEDGSAGLLSSLDFAKQTT